MNKAEIIAKITSNVHAILVPAQKSKAYPSGIELWTVGILVTVNADGLVNGATQDFFWNPETDEARFTGSERKNYVAPQPETPEPTPIEKAKAAVDAVLGVDGWTFVGISDGPHGTVAKIRRKDDQTLLAVSMAADGTPVLVESE